MDYVATIAVQVAVPFSAEGDAPPDTPKPPKDAADRERFDAEAAEFVKTQRKIGTQRRAAAKAAESEVAAQVEAALGKLGTVTEIGVASVEAVE